ncbi:Nucleotide-binding universal stress protein, UspA family [Pseudorhodobacter antarcticus]|uniref:Nucleotide-binding universal stress protein, UspA family n=1 Tax=Pseudorhodobacter antarcticus TaxID=1077947 RepID=A0A1H8E3Z2_9RHOB|nr:universal stress protein [Pseudorhodobacter antarcticus]SEN13508.1 Nucleotide-binding universal stress protein, UspA family [Pseudorhodobacter antarcticus]
MAYKSIQTICTDPARTAQTFGAAASLAIAQDAHLDALAIGIDRSQISYSYVGASVAVMQLSQENATTDVKAVEAAIRTAAGAAGPALRWSSETAIAMIGGMTELVALRARFADLVILGKPYGTKHGEEEEAIVESAMFEGQAPVLILPDTTVDASSIGKRIVVAWNQSREGLTAIRHALPFLQKAEKVFITIIDPPQHGPERSDPGGALCTMLVRHGVKAEVSVLARTMPRISDVLARHARDQNADMIVMGAYGHSRFREAILGGATRHMLETAEVPIFMAH